MFTGIVEELGTVRATVANQGGARLELACHAVLDDARIGDSIAVNGCCLTVAELDPAGASFDLLGQTLAVTSLGDLAAGSIVNLERALRAGDRFGGHFVQGHVDATGTIVRAFGSYWNTALVTSTL